MRCGTPESVLTSRSSADTTRPIRPRARGQPHGSRSVMSRERRKIVPQGFPASGRGSRQPTLRRLTIRAYPAKNTPSDKNTPLMKNLAFIRGVFLSEGVLKEEDCSNTHKVLFSIGNHGFGTTFWETPQLQTCRLKRLMNRFLIGWSHFPMP